MVVEAGLGGRYDATNVLQQDSTVVLEAKSDPNCLALMKHYRSLMAMSQEASKPIFHLRPADGAIGAHYAAVSDAREQFEALANRIDGATFGKPNTAG